MYRSCDACDNRQQILQEKQLLATLKEVDEKEKARLQRLEEDRVKLGNYVTPWHAHFLCRERKKEIGRGRAETT